MTLFNTPISKDNPFNNVDRYLATSDVSTIVDDLGTEGVVPVDVPTVTCIF